MKIYKVGGAIRDRIMNRPVRDTDYVALGTDEAGFLSVFPYAKAVGKKKAVYIIKGNEYTLSRSKDIAEDLDSRDLTINAIAEDGHGVITAHPMALDDIQNRILRPVRHSNFMDDPLRVFRAARFYAGFPDFSVSDDLVSIMRDISKKGMLDSISPERVGMEVIKAFSTPVPSRFLRLLVYAECITPWLGELETFHDIPAGPAPHHDNSLFDHTCDVMDRLAGNSLLVWMGFCHDLGKSLTDRKMLPHHYGHEKTGIKIAETIGSRLRLPGNYIKAGMTASMWHMKAGMYGHLRPGTRVDMLTALTRENLFHEMFTLSRADRQNGYAEDAKKDMDAILKARLPHEFRNLGEKSACKMRELRCQAVAENIIYGQKSL